MLTRVYITIDTECTEERLIRGRIRPPVGYELMMWGRFANQRRPLGIELIMQELERCGALGTFFVEALCMEVFGREGLTAVCSAVRQRGHDVQLHLHPNLRRPEWRRAGGKPLPDNIGDYSLDQQKALLRDGINHLMECGVPRESLVGFRAGNYGASNQTWDAMQPNGLTVDSSLNVGYVGRGCDIQWPRPEIDLFQARAGVWELPVGNFREGSWYRHLEITAISSAEMIRALESAHGLGVGHVTIVMHPGEFFVIDSAEHARGRPNRINIGRLRRVLSYLAAHADQFVVTTVGGLGRALLAGEIEVTSGRPDIPSGSLWLRPLRLVSQVAKRIDTRYGVR